MSEAQAVPPGPLHIGVDLGGTKIEAAVLDSAGQVLMRQRRATPANDYTATLNALYALLNEIDERFGTQGQAVGFGTPGAISSLTGKMKNCNSTCLNQQDLAGDLRQRLNRPIKLANDADCMTLSEATDGAAAGASIVFGVILGTGVGGGICIDGKLICGPNRISGEWGHNPLPFSSEPERTLRPCYCGRHGCIETFLSGPGLARSAELALGRACSSEQLIADLRSGCANAATVFAQYTDQLARALAGVINILDPHVIVLAGGLSNIDELYPALVHRLPAYVFSDSIATKVVRASHGDSSGVRGAAWL